MTLLELCEPLFLYICRLNRSARKGGAGLEYDRVRAEIEGIFKEIAARADAEPGLVSQYEKVEEVLVFFVDSMLSESTLPFAEEWHRNRLAYERNELAGDEKFWDLLDETLQERSSEATERLSIYRTPLHLLHLHRPGVHGLQRRAAGAAPQEDAPVLRPPPAHDGQR